MGRAQRRQVRAVERLAHIDVAEARHHLLVQQRRLQGGAPVGAGPRQIVGVEGIAQGLGAEIAQQRMGVQPVIGHHEDGPEPTRIVEGDARPAGKMQHHVVVRAAGMAWIVECGLRPAGGRVLHPQRPGHAQMQQQHLAAAQVRQEIFGAPAHGLDAPAGEAFDEIFRQGPAQIGPARLDALDHRALQNRHETAADRLHLGQFRHFDLQACGRSVPANRHGLIKR